ncbi:MAG TPA: RNA polymerase sigma factor [Planctomycetota bacterium]|nr:RNA polymerase sigma factor [Planctomycetota bacterium]
MPSQDAITDEGWLTHAAALRALAAALTNDANEAQDLIQETWLRALRHEGSGDRPRSWWAAVLRNLARNRARQRRQRAHDEREAARDERLPSEFEVLERLEVAQRVAAEVTRLDEPYRTTIHLRYFEGLSPDEIAKRSQAPLETVRARLRRGLALLRERMDRASGGDRNAWSVSLASIAIRGKPTALAALGSSLITIGGIAMSAKIALGVAAAVVIGIGAYLLRPGGDPSTPNGPAVVEAAAPGLPAALPAAESAQSESSLGARAEAAQSDPTPVAASGDDTIEVRGTVVIVDEQGVERRSESGTVLASFGTQAKRGQTRPLDFTKGAWSLRIGRGDSLGFYKLVASEREALLAEDSRFLQPGSEPIEVRGRWLKRGRLRVVDAATKRELRDIELRYSDDRHVNWEWVHPGDSIEKMSLLRFVSSPVDLPERLKFTPYWLHVAGYAWLRVDFDHLVGGERTVELLDPASISVTITGTPPPGVFVRLYPTRVLTVRGETGPKSVVSEFGEDAVSVHASMNGPTLITDLAPATYLAAVESGVDESKQRLGEQLIVLPAGPVTDVTVVVDASKLDVPMVHLFGTLALPEGSDVANARLCLWREGGGADRVALKIAEMTLLEGDERVRNWDAGNVRTGSWGASVESVGYRQLIHADEPGKLRVEIVVPPLVTVSIDVSDAATGDALKPERIMWSDARIEGLSMGFGVHVLPLDKKGAYWFSAPAGVASVSCDLTGYTPFYEQVSLTGAEHSLHIKLERAAGVHVEVFEGEARLRAGFDFFFAMRITLVGQRRPLGRPSQDTEFECSRLLDPGRYEIKFPILDGYEPIEPLTVDVAAGQILDVRVNVKHKQ